MIEHTNLISEENGYKSFNFFQIDDSLKELLFEDYYNYKTEQYNKQELVDNLYNTNFTNKYDPVAHKQIFDLYIDNEKFIDKAKFIYSVIDANKYTQFAQQNQEIENPDEMTITYSVIDSVGVKVQIYRITIEDIAFLF